MKEFKILIATDGSEDAAAACRFVRALALPDYLLDPWEHRAAVEAVLHKQEEAGAELLAQAQEALAAQGIATETVLRTGDPATHILRLAKQREVDLIVAGARGVSLLEGIWMGSVADRLLRDAPCSVLIVP